VDGTAAPLRAGGGVMKTRMSVMHRAGELPGPNAEPPIVIRPISSADGPLLLEGFDRLSEESRRLRFLGGKNALTAAEVRYFTDVDHRDHEAVVALDLAGRGAGVARYVRDRQLRHTAEIAIVVVDAWHRHGVGTRLLRRLAQRAADEGIRCFTGLMADDNVAIVGLLRSVGARIAVTGGEPGAVRFTVPVASMLAEPEHADDLVASRCCA
jgi:GNAT superfamily N-acetyltransferase